MKYALATWLILTPILFYIRIHQFQSELQRLKLKMHPDGLSAAKRELLIEAVIGVGGVALVIFGISIIL